jgi:hypothetical protein
VFTVVRKIGKPEYPPEFVTINIKRIFCLKHAMAVCAVVGFPVDPNLHIFERPILESYELLRGCVVSRVEPTLQNQNILGDYIRSRNVV